jgi:hypothetical protein
MCMLKRCKDEREERKRGASLSFLCTCGLILHPVPRINKQDSSPLILSPPISTKDLLEKLEKLKFSINVGCILVWTSKSPFGMAAAPLKIARAPGFFGGAASLVELKPFWKNFCQNGFI